LTSVVHSFKEPALYYSSSAPLTKPQPQHQPQPFYQTPNETIKMRFSIIAAAFMASAVYAGESTLYVTEEVTITSCAPYVYPVAVITLGI
jgi:hypothetical protein